MIRSLYLHKEYCPQDTHFWAYSKPQSSLWGFSSDLVTLQVAELEPRRLA